MYDGIACMDPDKVGIFRRDQVSYVGMSATDAVKLPVIHCPITSSGLMFRHYIRTRLYTTPSAYT